MNPSTRKIVWILVAIGIVVVLLLVFFSASRRKASPPREVAPVPQKQAAQKVKKTQAPGLSAPGRIERSSPRPATTTPATTPATTTTSVRTR